MRACTPSSLPVATPTSLEGPYRRTLSSYWRFRTRQHEHYDLKAGREDSNLRSLQSGWPARIPLASCPTYIRSILGGLNGFVTLPQSYILILNSSDLMYTAILSELTNSFEANSLVLHSLRRQLSDFPAVQQFEGCLSYSL